MLTAKVYIKQEARSEVLWNGYVKNLFGKGFEDYDTQMKFCTRAIVDMENRAQKAKLPLPIHDDIEQSMQIGKNIIIAYTDAISTLINGSTQEIANKKLQIALRNAVNKTFN